MTDIIVLSDNPSRDGASKLIKICFVPVFGDVAKFCDGDMILSEAIDQKAENLNYIGAYYGRLTLPVNDARGYRVGYAVNPIPQQFKTALDEHVLKINKRIIDMYRWLDTGDFKLSGEMGEEIFSH